MGVWKHRRPPRLQLCACLFKCHDLRNGDLARHNGLFYSLEQWFPLRKVLFPENMLFQGLLIPECSESHRDTPARFQSQGLWREGTVGGGALPHVSYSSELKDFQFSSCRQARQDSHLCNLACCGRNPARTNTKWPESPEPAWLIHTAP